MPNEDEQFFQRLLEAFQAEAREHIQGMSTGLLELEGGPPPERRAEVIETVFREAHSLKGASRAVDLRPIETVCQALETVFSAWKKGTLAPRAGQFDILLQAVNLTAALLDPATAPRRSAIAETVEQVKRITDSTAGAAPGLSVARPDVREMPVSPPGSALQPQVLLSAESVRISTEKLDSVLLQAEELLAAKVIAGQRVTELRELRAEVARIRGEWIVAEPELRALRSRPTGAHFGGSAGGETSARQQLLAGALESHGIRLKALEDRIGTIAAATARDHRALGNAIDKLLEDAKRLVMLPFATLLEGFPRLVREIAREQGKEVQLILRGHDVEIDKRILEEIKDPLIHILRNAVDHGIELPQDRQPKPARASIGLTIDQASGNEVRITVTDDGRGLDVAKIKGAAVKAGKVTPAQARRLSNEDARNLIFRSDVTTSKMITEISGRGLGLAIAREKVLKLGGRISAISELGRGTAFTISVPVTLATLRAVLVRAGGQTFAIPVTQIDCAIGFGAHEIHPVEGREALSLNQRVVPLVRLDEALDLPGRAAPERSGADPDAPRVRTRFAAVVLGSAEQRIAFRVDEIGIEHEVLVKPLGKPLIRVRNVAGATVLADGRPVPLLHVPDLLKSASQLSHPKKMQDPAVAEGQRPNLFSVLVAEDSITARMLLKNVLESAGYSVTTAVDGAEALATLRTGEFGLVVSDIDMPRMDGIELTAAIRRDARLASLPVVLVTARESREDRERGIDVGANAYIVKSTFDQGDLLDVIRRLV